MSDERTFKIIGAAMGGKAIWVVDFIII